MAKEKSELPDVGKQEQEAIAKREMEILKGTVDSLEGVEDPTHRTTLSALHYQLIGGDPEEAVDHPRDLDEDDEEGLQPIRTPAGGYEVRSIALCEAFDAAYEEYQPEGEEEPEGGYRRKPARRKAATITKSTGAARTGGLNRASKVAGDEVEREETSGGQPHPRNP